MHKTFTIFLIFLSAFPLLAYRIDPMVIEIDLAHESAINVKIINDQEDMLRAELNLSERRQEKDGSYKEIKSDALQVYPPLVQIPPGSSRNVRLMIKPQFRKKSTGSYHGMTITEILLANGKKQKKTASGLVINIATAFHLPILIYPEKKDFSIQLNEASYSAGKITTQIANKGNAILRLHDQEAYVKIKGNWRACGAKQKGRNNVIVVGNVIEQNWACESYNSETVEAVQIRGDALRWKGFLIEKTLSLTHSNT